MSDPRAGQQIHPHVFLAGRPPIGEFLSFVKSMAIDGQALDNALLVEEWRQANKRITALESEQAGVADNPPVTPLDEATAKKVVESPLFANNFRVVPSEPAIVDLDTVVVYQKFINLSFIETILAALGNDPSDESILRLAFGTDNPPVNVMQTAQNQFVFISQSNDFRFLGCNMVAPPQVVGLPAGNNPTHIVTLAVGYGSNLLNVIHYKNRFLLNNGSHRAYAVRKIGKRMVPCVIQHVSTKEELELINEEVHRNPERYFDHVRPPMLRDYFDPSLTKIVPVQAKNRVVRISFGVELSDIPFTQ